MVNKSKSNLLGIVVIVCILVLLLGGLFFYTSVIVPEQEKLKAEAEQKKLEEERIKLRDYRIMICTKKVDDDYPRVWAEWCELQSPEMIRTSCKLPEHVAAMLATELMGRIDNCYMIYWDKTTTELKYLE